MLQLTRRTVFAAMWENEEVFSVVVEPGPGVVLPKQWMQQPTVRLDFSQTFPNPIRNLIYGDRLEATMHFDGFFHVIVPWSAVRAMACASCFVGFSEMEIDDEPARPVTPGLRVIRGGKIDTVPPAAS